MDAPRGTLFYSNPSKNYALAGTGTTAGTGVLVTTWSSNLRASVVVNRALPTAKRAISSVEGIGGQHAAIGGVAPVAFGVLLLAHAGQKFSGLGC